MQQPASHPPDPRLSPPLHIACLAVLAAVALVLFARVGGFEYAVTDDYRYVADNGAVRDGLSLQGLRWAMTSLDMDNWHPLTWISYMLDVSLFGVDPGLQHIENAIIHSLTSMLVYALGWKILRNQVAALVVAFLFLAHPLHMESVAWIAERKDLLCGFFYVLALWCHLRYRERPGALRYLAVLLAAVMALMSKAMAVTLPVALLLLDFWPLRRMGTGRLPGASGGSAGTGLRSVLIEKLPLALMSGAVCAITLTAQQGAMIPAEQLPLAFRLSNATVAYGIYLRDLLFPTRLAAFYPLEQPDVVRGLLPSLLALVLFSGIAWRMRVRHPVLLFGWLWFLAGLLPVIGLVQVGTQSHADRYMYLPALGPFLVAGAALSQSSPQVRRYLRLPLLAVLGFYASMAWIQLGYWANPYLLYTRMRDVNGDHYRIHTGLAAHYLRHGRLDLALAEASEALRMGPRDPLLYSNLAFVLLQAGDFRGAERMFRKSLDIAPDSAIVWSDLGVALEQQGRLEEARACFETASRLDPYLHIARGKLQRPKD